MPTEKQKFINWLNSGHGLNIRHDGDLSLLKTNDKAVYWEAIWDNYNVQASKDYKEVLSKAGVWFTDSALNYSEHILRKKDDNQDAISFTSESVQNISISWQELETQTASFADYLKYKEVKKGDIVAGVLGNSPEHLYSLLACNSIGAIWVNISPNLEGKEMINHLQQLEPKILISQEIAEKQNIATEINKLACNLPHLKQIVVVPSPDFSEGEERIEGGKYWNDTFSMAAPPLSFEALPFDFPLYLTFKKRGSLLPEPIAHPQGGILLTELEQLGIENSFRWNDTVKENTVLGTPLLLGATVEYFDGNPKSDSVECLIGKEITIFKKEKGANYPDLEFSFVLKKV